MSVISILQYPDPRLRKKAKTVVDFKDKHLQKTIDDMFETLYHTENCAGLAATQLDIADPYRVTVIDVSMEKNQPLCLINAEVVSHEGEITQWEGCMSVSPDDVHGKVTRPSKIKARAFDRHGKIIEIEAEGLLAKCIQHEIDHLNGGLYIDRLSPLKRLLVDNKINKLRKRSGSE